MKKLVLAAAGAAALFATPALAQTTTVTESWYVPSTVDLRAGPDTNFPVVANIPANAHMSVQGCLQGWTWCDVAYNGQRGWVAGTNIQTTYENKPTFVAQAAPEMKVPVETYTTTSYWDANYKSAPFYTQREKYTSWTVPASQ